MAPESNYLQRQKKIFIQANLLVSYVVNIKDPEWSWLKSDAGKQLTGIGKKHVTKKYKLYLIVADKIHPK